MWWLSGLRMKLMKEKLKPSQKGGNERQMIMILTHENVDRSAGKHKLRSGGLVVSRRAIYWSQGPRGVCRNLLCIFYYKPRRSRTQSTQTPPSNEDSLFGLQVQSSGGFQPPCVFFSTHVVLNSPILFLGETPKAQVRLCSADAHEKAVKECKTSSSMSGCWNQISSACMQTQCPGCLVLDDEVGCTHGLTKLIVARLHVRREH